jgi:uncharacterized protein YciI
MSVFAVRSVHASAWDRSRGIREQDGWDDHAAFMDGLVDDGFVLFGGPIGDGESALLAIEAGDEQAIRDRFAADPWMIKGLLELSSIEHWTIWLDGMRRQ